MVPPQTQGIYGRVGQNGMASPEQWPSIAFDELQKRGKEESEKVGGNPKILEAFLGTFYDHDSESANLRREIMDLSRQNHQKEQERAEHENFIHDIRQSIRGLEDEEEKWVLEKEDQIRGLKVEIKRIRGGDYTLLGTDADPSNRLAYFIGTVIIIFLSGYLLLFYTSVIYNAFLLDPIKAAILSSKSGIASTMTIANLRALPQTYRELGFLGAAFLITASFMFIALGFLLHWFNQLGRRMYLFILYGFTFLFDAFLAYEIVHKIYFARSIVEEMPRWNFFIAIKDPQFYIILCAGFGIYVIWGVLLSYLLDEHFKILPARVGIRHRQAEIQRLRSDIKEIQLRFGQKVSSLKREVLEIKQREVGKLHNDLQSNQMRIKLLKEKLQKHFQQSGINAQAIQNKVTPFFAGWCQHIQSHYAPESSSELIKESREVLDNFYKTTLLN